MSIMVHKPLSFSIGVHELAESILDFTTRVSGRYSAKFVLDIGYI